MMLGQRSSNGKNYVTVCPMIIVLATTATNTLVYHCQC